MSTDLKSSITLSATIVLGRQENNHFEILLLRRNKALTFAGGLWVFPGGKLEATDESSESELISARTAAIREAKEETGLVINPEELIFFSHWTTPVGEPRRFATYFFYADISSGDTQVNIDDSEIKDHLWLTPNKAIEKSSKGDLAMLPPTLMSIYALRMCISASEAATILRQVEPAYILPVLIKDQQHLCCLYEGDAGYISSELTAEGDRHRLTIDMQSGIHEFEFDCISSISAVDDFKQNKPPIRIELTLSHMFPTVNCYLVPGNKLTLIDCGWDSDENFTTLATALKEAGYNWSDIDQILITHEHPDHVGLLSRIITLTEATIHAPEQTRPWFIAADSRSEQQRSFYKSLNSRLGYPEALRQLTDNHYDSARGFPNIELVDRIQFYKADDTFTIGHSNYIALHTPGHCPNQFMFLSSDHKRVFSGDMLLPIAPMPIITAIDSDTGKPSPALRQLISSFYRIKNYYIHQVYPGHGEIYDNANRVIDKQLARISERKEECFQIIVSGALTPYAIHLKMYPNHTLPPNYSGMHMILGYLDLLEQEDRISLDVTDTGEYEVRLIG